MSLRSFALLALSGTHTWATSTSGSGPAKRQSTTAKYCPGGTQICFSEFREPTSNIYYRIAIPEVSAAPFDVLLQIVAPLDKAGWAGVAWGGKMNGNPLTVGWPSGDSAVVSSRWSTQWEGGSLDPNGVNSFAWAKNTQAVNSASNTSSFGYHDGRGVFDHDLSAARIPQGVFDAIIYGLNNPTPPETDTAAATVSTAVVTIPKPSTAITSSSSKATPTRATELSSSAAVKTTPVVVTTRVTQLPKPTSTSTRRTSPDPLTSSPTTRKPTTPGVVTLTVTARPPTTTQDDSGDDDDDDDDDGRGEWPPWTGGGGPPWGRGKGKGGGGGWGRGGGRRGRRGRLVVPPGEY
ncbi:uncharacterized protein B0H64DRAFT_421180 [Chaetomium fimeti]|uniref:Cellobiose dehydrogenase-like cytochrome domain-containing protein n=1 Tax=Chaetomium fimeti TaxID=1854472 RepID=A0AAE0H5I6_9PEZI|nr:hypothetical protein B0H64DRAFT_421180 [Chaetomium fimeti]